MSAFPTPELDKILKEKDIQGEQQRQTLLAKTQQWLHENAVKYGINRAYIFGGKREFYGQPKTNSVANPLATFCG